MAVLNAPGCPLTLSAGEARFFGRSVKGGKARAAREGDRHFLSGFTVPEQATAWHAHLSARQRYRVPVSWFTRYGIAASEFSTDSHSLLLFPSGGTLSFVYWSRHGDSTRVATR